MKELLITKNTRRELANYFFYFTIKSNDAENIELDNEIL